MTTLLLTLLVAGLALAVILYVGSMFLQGYIYTEPSEGMTWQAPAAAVALGGFLTVWCLFVANSATASPGDIPYDTLFRFSPHIDMVAVPVKEITAVTSDGKRIVYQTKRLDQNRYLYIDKAFYLTTGRERGWNPDKVTAVLLTHDGQEMFFEVQPAKEGGYRTYLHRPSGYAMEEFDAGPTGVPRAFRYGRFLFNLTLNLLFLVVWFVCLWVILRFQWSHALGLALCFWLVLELAILPMLLGYAAEVAQANRQATAGAGAPAQ